MIIRWVLLRQFFNEIVKEIGNKGSFAFGCLWLNDRNQLNTCFNLGLSYTFSYTFNYSFNNLNCWLTFLTFLYFLFTQRLYLDLLFNLFPFSSCSRRFLRFDWMILQTKRAILAQLQLLKFDELYIVMIKHDPASLHRFLFHQADPVQKLRGHDLSTDSADNNTGPAYWVVIPRQEGNILVIQYLFRDDIVDLRIKASCVIKADEARRSSLWVKVNGH